MFKKMFRLGIIAFFVLFLTSTLSMAEEPTNYCKDPQSWVEWNDLVEKYPNDKDIQTLHALRIGLCAKIEQGSIRFHMANQLFNRAHEMVYRMKKRNKKGASRPLRCRRLIEGGAYGVEIDIRGITGRMSTNRGSMKQQ